MHPRYGLHRRGAAVSHVFCSLKNLLVPLELVVGLEEAHRIIGVALVDGRNAAELLVVPRVGLAVRLDDRFCKRVLELIGKFVKYYRMKLL